VGHTGIQSPIRFSVVQLRRLGDVILTTPALSALRSAKSGRDAIVFLVEASGRRAVAGTSPRSTKIMAYDADGAPRRAAMGA